MLLILLLLLVHLCLVAATCLSDLISLYVHVVCNSGVEGTLVVGIVVSPTDITQSTGLPACISKKG